MGDYHGRHGVIILWNITALFIYDVPAYKTNIRIWLRKRWFDMFMHRILFIRFETNSYASNWGWMIRYNYVWKDFFYIACLDIPDTKGVSNPSRKTSKTSCLCIAGPLRRLTSIDGWSRSYRAGNAESVSMSWYHHVLPYFRTRFTINT